MAPEVLKRWFPKVEWPAIISAPMYTAANGALAAEVSRAGGLGFIPGGFDLTAESADLVDLEKQLCVAREILALPESSTVFPIGVGFLTCHPSAANFKETAIPILQKHRPAAVWLFIQQAGSDVQRDMIKTLRDVSSPEGWSPKVFVQVGTVAAAAKAFEDGADCIVAQGVDAGGHQWAQGASVISLVPEVKALLQTKAHTGREIVLLAAGGITTGSGVAACLALGADGVVMGTKFLASEEASCSATKKQVIVQTSDGGLNTVKSMIHDHIEHRYFWPEDIDGRAVVGPYVLDQRAGLSLAENQEKMKAAIAAGDTTWDVVWAGTGIGMVNEILPAAQIVKQTQVQAREVIRRLGDGL